MRKSITIELEEEDSLIEMAEIIEGDIYRAIQGFDNYLRDKHKHTDETHIKITDVREKLYEFLNEYEIKLWR